MRLGRALTSVRDLQEHPTSAFDNEKSIFQKALSTKVVDYVEEELRPQFGQLISFVTKFESILNAQDEAKEEELSRSNASGWRDGRRDWVEDIH